MANLNEVYRNGSGQEVYTNTHTKKKKINKVCLYFSQYLYAEPLEGDIVNSEDSSPHEAPSSQKAYAKER